MKYVIEFDYERDDDELEMDLTNIVRDFAKKIAENENTTNVQVSIFEELK